MIRRVIATFAALAALGTAGCGSADAQFHVDYAPDYARGPTTMSVFAVFKDGRLNPQAWDEVGPELAKPFGGKDACTTLYTNDFVAASPGLSGAMDDYSRANGVTDELLERFMPAAQGDTVLVLTMAGHPPHQSSGPVESTFSPSSAPMNARGMGPARPPPGRGGSRTPVDTNEFDVSATLYSVRLHRPIARVSMAYTGRTVEDAMRKFVAELTRAIPGATCRGWKPDVHVDEAEIRKIIAQ